MSNKIKILSFLFLLIINCPLSSQTNPINKENIKLLSKIDSLELTLKKTGLDTNRIKLLNDLSTELIGKGEYQIAIDSLIHSQSLAEKLTFKKGNASACNSLGNAYWYMGNYEKALQYWLAALKIWEETDNKKGIASSRTNIGMIYSKQGNYKKALENYLSSLKIGQSIHDKKTIANAYSNMGNDYSEQGFAATNKEEKKNKYALALENIMKALRLFQEIVDQQAVAHTYINIGNIYYDLGNIASTKKEASDWYQKDIEFQFKALKIKKELGNKQGIAICYSSIGIVYDMMEDLHKSAYYLEKALALYKEINYKSGIKGAYANLSQLAEERGDDKKALMYYKLFSAIKDSLLNEKSSNQLIEMATKYESEKKEKENEVLQQKNQLLNQQNKIQDLKIQQSRYLIFRLILLSILIIGMAFLLIRQNKLNAMHAKIEMEQKLLRSQMNPHFIFNAMVGIQNYIYKEEPEVAANYLSSVVHLMRAIIDNSRKEYVLLEKEISTLHHYLSLQKVRFHDKFNYLIDVDPDLDVESISIPPMMAQPFIENAIIHGIMHKTQGEGMIVVKFIMQQNCLSLEIEDNGVGREKAKEFGLDKEHVSVATNITQERLTILNRKAKNKSSVTILDLKNNTGDAKGTRVTFLFPLTKK